MNSELFRLALLESVYGSRDIALEKNEIRSRPQEDIRRETRNVRLSTGAASRINYNGIATPIQPRD